ncbi:MAG: hypothetical protein KF886_04595 [Candidatus Hydrogenedentes bacterium]|nr:hypothetical protein [Candidatus Hydrogenedentota bacterium]
MKRCLPMPDCARALALIAAALVAATLSPGPAATAQEPEHALTTSRGVGTVYARPAAVTFRIQKTEAGDSVEAAMAGALALERDVREALAKSELRPALIEVTAPALLSIDAPAVQSVVTLEFPMAPYAGAEAGPAKFAGLCDRMKELAAGAGGQLLGPELRVADEAAVIQEAVRESARNAYIAAAGAAGAMGASVSAVELLEVESITWNAPPDSPAAYPSVDTVACTVVTRVTYLLDYR